MKKRKYKSNERLFSIYLILVNTNFLTNLKKNDRDKFFLNQSKYLSIIKSKSIKFKLL